MIHFFTNFKEMIPKNIRLILHKLYFDNLMVFYEKYFNFKKLYFNNLELPEYDSIIDYKTRSLIRHKLYEKYEIEAINKLELWDDNFIDLGSSIGLCSYLVGSKMNSSNMHILVEPNKVLLEYSKLVMSKLENKNKIFINKAVGYSTETMFFDPSDNILSGKVVNYKRNDSFDSVYCTNIGSLIKTHEIKSFNVLIDIEGLSFLPIFNEEASFKICKKLIIEESFGENYNFYDVKNQLEKLGFKITYKRETWGSNIIGAEKLT
jgi:FkbM family methyltransferase